MATISSRHARLEAFWTIATDIDLSFRGDAYEQGSEHHFQANLG
jgi:hypothetical protein